MTKFTKAIILRNEKKPTTLEAFHTLKDKLQSRGLRIVKMEDADEQTIAFVLGGDGTVLKASKILALKNVGVVGINFGHLGFLSPYEFGRIDDVLHKILDQNAYTTVKRSFLKVAYASGKEEMIFNDFVIQRAVRSHMLKVAVSVDGSSMGEMLCDGMIFSTSTGSTAYNLSAGGSVIDPNLSLISIVPMMAHAFAAWPVITSFDRKITVSVKPRESEKYFCIGDGEELCMKNETQKFEISGSQKQLNFLCTFDINFFKLVHTKLGWGIHNGFGGNHELKM
jgi:NAD+ kinase